MKKQTKKNADEHEAGLDQTLDALAGSTEPDDVASVCRIIRVKILIQEARRKREAAERRRDEINRDKVVTWAREQCNAEERSDLVREIERIDKKGSGLA